MMDRVRTHRWSRHQHDHSRQWGWGGGFRWGRKLFAGVGRVWSAVTLWEDFPARAVRGARYLKASLEGGHGRCSFSRLMLPHGSLSKSYWSEGRHELAVSRAGRREKVRINLAGVPVEFCCDFLRAKRYFLRSPD